MGKRNSEIGLAVSIKQSNIMYIPAAEQRKALDAWIANERQETQTVDVPGWDEMCRCRLIDPEAVTPLVLDQIVDAYIDAIEPFSRPLCLL